MAPKAAAKAKAAKTPRKNAELVPGVHRRSSEQQAKHLFFKQKAIGKIEKKIEKKPRAAAVKKAVSRLYRTEKVARPLKRTVARKPARLRPSIKAGAVLIVLSGRFRGKRVIFLKQLPSGLLLVTGPFQINGVPLRRLNQAYVIATTTSVDISKVTIPDRIDDAYFSKKADGDKPKKTEENFFDDKRGLRHKPAIRGRTRSHPHPPKPTGEAEKDKAALEAWKKAVAEKKPVVPKYEARTKPKEVRIADQKAVDESILAVIKTVPYLKRYLSSTFTLSKGQYPHNMIF